MFYHIQYLCPRSDISLGRCGFSIALWPSWKDAVASSDLTQDKIDAAINGMGRRWLDGCGYNAMYDPDEPPDAKWQRLHGEQRKLQSKERKLGPNARPLYEPRQIRISWGQWGPEHITVPGNACGLDIDYGLGRPPGGAVLQPHNIDSFGQVILLLTVFTWVADCLIQR